MSRRPLLYLIISITFICVAGVDAQNAVMSPDAAQEQALELLKEDVRVPEWGQRFGLGWIFRRQHAKEVEGYTAGEPYLIKALKPSEALLNSEKVRALCLNSSFFNEIALEGEELPTCLADLRGADEYEVPIYDENGRYFRTISFEAEGSVDGNFGWGWGEYETPSTEQALALLSVEKAELYEFTLQTDLPARPDDWVDSAVEGHQILWLADTRAVDYRTGELYQVVDSDGNPVDLLTGEVEPTVVEKSYIYMTGEETRPLLAFPVKLEPLEP